MKEVFIPPRVSELLLASLVKEADLAAAVVRARHVPDPARPGQLICRCTVAVPRPMDPETAVLRELEVQLRRTETGYEIHAVKGLDRAG